MSQSKPNNIETRFIPFPKWPDFHPDPSVPALRDMHFRNVNGFSDECVLKRGRRLLIDEAKYFEWLRRQNSLKQNNCNDSPVTSRAS